jgi:hypothetical protein
MVLRQGPEAGGKSTDVALVAVHDSTVGGTQLD